MSTMFLFYRYEHLGNSTTGCLSITSEKFILNEEAELEDFIGKVIVLLPFMLS